MILAVVLVLLIVGSLLFHFLTPWYFTPIASNWGAIDDTIGITFWITGFVFVAVNLFVAYCLVRFRTRKGRHSAYEPENKKLEWWLTGVTTIGVASMLAPGLFVWANFVRAPADASVFEAVGQQWHWRYRFPGNDGELGTTDARHISEKNPFGLNPDDPKGKDDVLVSSQELHLPLGRPFKAELRSIDVLHNFAVPQFRAKMDLIPGSITFVWFTPTREGTFDLLCNELCGVAHYAMRGRVVVEQEQAFQAWLRGYPTFGETIARAPGDAAAGQQLYATCAACHGAQAEGNRQLNAPKLAGLEDWYLRRQLKYFKEGARGTHEQDTFGRLMAPMAATLPDEAAIANVSAYVASLPDKPAARTVGGNPGDGKRLFVSTCGACHGPEGRGSSSTNAPRLAGMSDWYLVTQLKNFRQGVRGTHPHDLYGPQMALLSATLADGQAVNDLVAYVNELR